MTSGSRASDLLRRLPDTFRAGAARTIGMTPRDLYRLRDDGELIELSRGVFRKVAAPEGHLDLIAVAMRVPRAVVCLESALALHSLIDDIPVTVHIAIPRGTRSPRIVYPPTTVHQFQVNTFDIGIETLEAAPGEQVRIYSAARCVVDAMRLRHVVGDVMALHALRVALHSRAARPAELIEMARVLRVGGPVMRAIEVTLS